MTHHVKLYNSLTGKKEDFIPANPEHIGVYACGPTVYSYAHIGNARMAVVFDMLVRILRAHYPRVTYVSNITDVDDKIMNASAETGMAIDEITRKFERIYNEDMATLGVNKPDIQPRATEHIGEMIALIEALIHRGHAYAAERHVLFNVPSFPAYGGLSGRSRDEQIAGARVEVSPFKKDPADFVLWKPSTQEQVGWDSPWGFGRPGWHIECSAMAEKHLGLPFDIHGGGADLKFPHHENEIAQSCCAHGHTDDLSKFARVWVHNGFVTSDGEKMSKSIGNIRLVHDLVAHYPGEVLRLALLSAQYRQPLDFSGELLDQMRAMLDKFYRSLFDAGIEKPADKVNADFIAAFSDDLNSPMALSLLNKLKGADLLAAGQFMGILNEEPARWLGFIHDGEEPAIVEKVEALLAARQKAKAEKDFAAADAIRDELALENIVIEDTVRGAQWRRIS
jgi:cysteinyl-tRNA synthetase